jgi:hypothetical protein
LPRLPQDIVKALGEPAAAAIVLRLGAAPTASLLKAMGARGCGQLSQARWASLEACAALPLLRVRRPGLTAWPRWLACCRRSLLLAQART